MGFGKFILKHGFGSPGAIAKAVTKDFLKWKKEYPDSSKKDLLRLTFLSRLKTHEIIGKRFVSENQIEPVLQIVGDKLFNLIREIELIEEPNSKKTYDEFPDIYETSSIVIKEVISKYAPKVD